MKGIAVAWLMACSCPSWADTLHLSCVGQGTANKLNEKRGTIGSSNDQSLSVVSQQRDRVGFADQVDVEINGDAGQIRMPRSMLPPAHGGKAGWMELKGLSVTDRAIDGSAAVNFINSPKVHIDRVTGILSIAGRSGDFIAQCKNYDPETVQRAF